LANELFQKQPYDCPIVC